MLAEIKPSALADLIRPLCKETAELLKPVGVSAFDRLFLSMEDDNTFRAYVKRQVQKDGVVSYDQYASGPANKWIGQIPESKYDAHKQEWLLAATDLNALLILASWHQQQVITSEAAGKMLEYLALRFINQFQTSALPQAHFKKDKSLPPGAKADSLQDGRWTEFEPKDYQYLAAHCASKATGGFAQFMDTGTGKTATTIETVVKEAETPILVRGVRRPLRVLVACPKQLRGNWGREIAKFCKREYRFINCHGGKIDRAKHLIDAVATSGVDIVFMAISYNNVKGSIGALQTVEWDIVVADESDNFKSPFTKLWKAMEKMRDVAKKRIALTATPVCNTLFDLWTQLEFLGKGFSGFNDFKAFKKFYGVFLSSGQGGVQRLLGYQNAPLLQERLTRLSYMISFDEACPEVPEVMCDTIDIELSEEQREAYDQLKSTLRLEVQDKLSGEENTVTMNNVLTMLLRLAHVTSGFLTFDEVYDLDTGEKLRDKRIDRYDPNPKLEELVSLVKNSRPNQKIIIWCCWVQSVKTIAARLEAEGIHGVTFFGGTSDPMRDVAEQRFNSESASDCKFLCGNPACGGVGMTFLGQSDDDTDCDWIIEYDYDWSWRKRKQGRGRNRRIGTRVPTRVTTLVTEDSIDEDIYMVLQRKQDTALNLQDMKEIMQKVLEL